MRFAVLLVILAAAVVLCSTGASAWTDDFEAYGQNLAWPWIANSAGDPQMNITPGNGWAGSKGIFANNPWDGWLYSLRPTGYTSGLAYSLTIKAKLGGGAYSRNNWAIENDSTVGGPAIYAEMNNANNTIEYGWWIGGQGGELWNIPIAENVWYESRITVTPTASGWDHSFALRFYQNGSWGSWQIKASGPCPAGFAPNFVLVAGVWAEAGTVMDDLKFAPASDDPIPEPRPADFGKQWVRTHPFGLNEWSPGGAHFLLDPARLDIFRASGLTHVMIYYPGDPWYDMRRVPTAKELGYTWHGQLLVLDPTHLADGTPSDVLGQIENVTTIADDNAWYLADEPFHSQLAGIGQVADWLRTNRPDALTYFNVSVLALLEAGHFDDMMSIVRPDIVHYHHYPYPTNGDTEIDQHFQYMMDFRARAKQYGVPFWSWMQAFYFVPSETERMPSESEMRMQAFSSLAAGCKGLSFLAYDTAPWGGGIGVILADGTLTPQYYYMADMNPELFNLGSPLRFLESTDVRFVPGRHNVTGGTAPNATPAGLTNCAAGAGGDGRITGVSVDASHVGVRKDGLIGFFTDDVGGKYFMLSNLYHWSNLSASGATLSFTITFDGTVSQLYRISRQTGQQEVVPVTGNQLHLTLPGGTGDLFSYTEFDLSPPSGSLTINSGAAITDTVAVALDLSASDSRGVARMRIKNSDSTWSQWMPVVATRDWTLTSTDGVKTVFVQYQDVIGNTQTCSDTIILDTGPPTAPGKPSAGSTYSNTSVRFTWATATDAGSGVATYNCKIGTTPGGDDVFSGSVGSATSKTVTGTNAVTYYCCAQAVDNMGHVGPWSEVSNGVIVDAVAPLDFTPTANPAGWTRTGTIAISFSTTDSASGLAYYTVALDNGPYLIQSSPYSVSVGGLSDGVHTVHVQAVDMVGNQRTKDVNIFVDKAAPSPGSASAPAEAGIVPVVVAYGGASDSASGLKKVELWYRNGSVGTWTPATCPAQTGGTGSFQFTDVSGDGTYYFDLVAEDNAGNRSAAASGDGDTSTVYATPAVTSIAQVKAAADGSAVRTEGVVTADFGDHVYIEAADRSCGIRVTKAAHGASVNRTVEVTGTVSTMPTQEHAIDAVSVTDLGLPLTLYPVGISNRALGGGDFGAQVGVSGGVGLNSIGLLVRTTGLVSGGSGSTFGIDDGSGVSVEAVLTSGLSLPADGSYIAVTGIVSCRKDAGGTVQRVVLVTSYSTY